MTEIKFEDIRKGDDIEVVWARGDRTSTVRGIAHHKAVDGWWETREGLMLVGPRDDGTIYRHPRPAPAEPEGVGVVVETGSGVQLVSIHPFPNGNRWVLLWRSGRGTSEHVTAWTWDYLVNRHGEIAVVREGM